MNLSNPIQIAGNEQKYVCPKCHKKSFWYNVKTGKYYCFLCQFKGQDKNIKNTKISDIENYDTTQTEITIEYPENYRCIDCRNDWEDAFEYIESRNINPYSMKFGTDDFRRIIFPCFENGSLVYWQARYIYKIPKNKSKVDNPKIKRNDVIYNIDAIDKDKITYITEGIFDALTIQGQALLGANYTQGQISKLAKKNPICSFVILDSDAKIKTNELSARLIKRGMLAFPVFLPTGFDVNDLGFTNVFTLIFDTLFMNKYLAEIFCVDWKLILKALELKYSIVSSMYSK
jgi:hypothetical protein